MIRKLTQAELAEIKARLSRLETLDSIAETYDVPRAEISRLCMWWLYTGKLVLQ